MLGNRKWSDGVKSGEYGNKGDEPVQSHSHAQQPLQTQSCVQEHCPGETGLPSPVLSGRSQNVSSTAFQSPELLSSVD